MIAVCDVLGFSELVVGQPLSQVVNSYMLGLYRCLEHSVRQEPPAGSEHPVDMLRQQKRLGVAWFSDTILLYGLDDKDETCWVVIEAARWLIHGTLFMQPNFAKPGIRTRAGTTMGSSTRTRSEGCFSAGPSLRGIRSNNSRTGVVVFSPRTLTNGYNISNCMASNCQNILCRTRGARTLNCSASWHWTGPLDHIHQVTCGGQMILQNQAQRIGRRNIQSAKSGITHGSFTGRCAAFVFQELEDSHERNVLLHFGQQRGNRAIHD